MALYIHAGVRACEIGNVMFGHPEHADPAKRWPAMDLVRLAIPRPVYTQSHIDYVVEAILEVFAERDALRGMRIVEEPPRLRHFTCHFAPL